MNKYIVTKPFSLLEKVLIVEKDEIYAEQLREMYHIYHPKTRKRMGSLSAQKFNDFVEPLKA
jgi:hypothetical protein